MGNTAAVEGGLKEAPVTIEQSVNGMVSQVRPFRHGIAVEDNWADFAVQLDAANRETSGKFASFDGAEIGW